MFTQYQCLHLLPCPNQLPDLHHFWCPIQWRDQQALWMLQPLQLSNILNQRSVVSHHYLMKWFSNLFIKIWPSFQKPLDNMFLWRSAHITSLGMCVGSLIHPLLIHFSQLIFYRLVPWYFYCLNMSSCSTRNENGDDFSFVKLFLYTLNEYLSHANNLFAKSKGF